MSQVRLVVAVCLCFALATSFASGKTAKGEAGLYRDAVATARSEIWQAINSGRCGSATAVITVNGEADEGEGFGMANREKGIPVDRNTLFNIGSISNWKAVFTASSFSRGTSPGTY